jgi:steroid delta-isomerase-like uncharacterized protein
MSKENIETARRALEGVFNEGNVDVIDEISTDDFVSHDALAGDGDKESNKQLAQGYREAFPDLHAEIEEIFAAGDKVVMRWTVTGTFENDIMGQKATGEKGRPVEGITIDRFEGDKIAESWSQWDTLTFLQDIGAVPSGAEATASS